MSGEHNVCGFVVREIKVILEYVNDKIHRRDGIVMDDDAIQWFEFGLGFFDDLNIGDDLEFHAINCKRITMRLKVGPFPCH